MAKTMVNWEAREYIERKKNSVWYVGFALAVIALIAIAILLQDWLFIPAIVLAAIALMIYVMRPPRMLHYSLDEKGLTEGNNLHLYSDYKSFGVLNDGGHYSIVLVPKKRFGLRLRVYFPETEGEQIVDVFGDHLPMEEVKLDLVDKIVRWLRI
ncbi:MAG: hypothetical protein Q4D22_00825 [Candidatus Saccharibacteria bacterium]|jgi:hypothetical protein|nr:hypothetical protein [Candidatus Saccharibacteria bacterium]